MRGERENTVQKTLFRAAETLLEPSSSEMDVVLSCGFVGDQSRVLYALSIPEYIEAWLKAPDAMEQRFVFNLQGQGGFQMDLYRSDALQERIHGYCQIISSNQVRYWWTAASRFRSAKTLVDIETLWRMGWCTINLKHSGFVNASDSDRYREMWCQSLLRLCRLLGKMSTNAAPHACGKLSKGAKRKTHLLLSAN